MKNIYFSEDTVSTNDLYFVCYMIERVSRQLKQRNNYTVNAIGKQGLERQLSIANVLHSANPEAVVHDWIEEYHLLPGTFDITDVRTDLDITLPTALQMGKVYSRLILATMQADENYADGILRVYNHPICQIIDNYNSSAYYEPSYYIAQAYVQGGF
jgi:hypothetical protein